MAGLVPNAGEEIALDRFLKTSDETLKLYVNDYTPVEGSVAGDFTEMSTQGYAAKTLTAASWSSGAYAQQTWTFDGTGGSTIVYGYFVIDAGTGVIMFAERFGTPPTIVNNGDQIKVTPTVTGD
mgnify:FL=1|jgi:hypothetical protein